MPFDFFDDENRTVGIQPNSQFQYGVSDFDNGGTNVEQDVGILWCSNPASTWNFYECTVIPYLDSGIVVHNHLPQVDNNADTLGSYFSIDANGETIANVGVNTVSVDRFTDLEQRMAHSRYWFNLVGRAVRVGYQIPIPKLKSIGGVVPTPYDREPQKAFNRIIANYSGVPVYYAEWSLWYTVTTPPASQQLPPANLAAHITADTPLPQQMQVPFSQPDAKASNTNPVPQLQNPIQG